MSRVPEWALPYVAAANQFSSIKPPLTTSTGSDRCTIELDGGELLILYRDEDLRDKTWCYAQIRHSSGTLAVGMEIIVDQNGLRKFVRDYLNARDKANKKK